METGRSDRRPGSELASRHYNVRMRMPTFVVSLFGAAVSLVLPGSLSAELIVQSGNFPERPKVRWLTPPKELRPGANSDESEGSELELKALSPLDAYERLVIAEIKKNWDKPSYIGDALLVVSLDRQGKLIKVSFVPLSGKESLDFAAVRALNKAVYESKFSPFPDDLTNKHLSFRFQSRSLTRGHAQEISATNHYFAAGEGRDVLDLFGGAIDLGLE